MTAPRDRLPELDVGCEPMPWSAATARVRHQGIGVLFGAIKRPDEAATPCLAR